MMRRPPRMGRKNNLCTNRRARFFAMLCLSSTRKCCYSLINPTRSALPFGTTANNKGKWARRRSSRVSSALLRPSTVLLLGAKDEDSFLDDGNGKRELLQHQPFQRLRVESLLSNAVSRAERTLSDLDSGFCEEEEDTSEDGTATGTTIRTTTTPASVTSLLSKATSRAERYLSTTSSRSPTTTSEDNHRSTPSPSSLPKDKMDDALDLAAEVSDNYGRNPTVTSTALAHSLWSYALRPGLDSAIDATAGNGADATVLAGMLFGVTRKKKDGSSFSSSMELESSCQLICVDVSERACENTHRELAALLPRETLDGHVQVLHRSHAPLPLPRNASSVGLVVYNLGYLPNRKHASRTETETTLASLADAALALRVGGLLSVLTYPRSNREEDAAVRAFLQGLALFSSISTDYRTFVQEIDEADLVGSSSSGGDDKEDTTTTTTGGDGRTTAASSSRSEGLRRLLLSALDRVLDGGGVKQTWRVYEHRKIGWDRAPILVTATRIK